ncbi:hypothetical protein [Pontiella sp.]|uniref:hypothetical protein n=1 Tax=Pontiella sp. TaxID=2837462 RepID=UPI0035622970
MLKNLLFSLLLALPAFTEDFVLAHSEVPNRLIPQGEVRLITRGSDAVVQSAIKTRYPGRVLSKITKSEKENWPGNAEMETYIAALETLFAEYEQREKGTVLLIDFISGPGGSRVELSIEPAPPWRTLKLSSAYVQKDQEYILADAFGRKADDVIKKLRALTPMENPHGK